MVGAWEINPSCHNLRDSEPVSHITVLPIIRGQGMTCAKPVESESCEEKYLGLISSYMKFLLFLARQANPFHQSDPRERAWETRRTPNLTGQAAAPPMSTRHRPHRTGAAQAGITEQHLCSFPTTLRGTCKTYRHAELPRASQPFVTSFFGCPPPCSHPGRLCFTGSEIDVREGASRIPSESRAQLSPTPAPAASPRRFPK